MQVRTNLFILNFSILWYLPIHLPYEVRVGDHLQ